MAGRVCMAAEVCGTSKTSLVAGVEGVGHALDDAAVQAFLSRMTVSKASASV